MRLVIAQLNLLVGGVQANAEQVIAAARRARDQHRADAVAFPELTLTGYPPEDLLLRPEFMQRVERALEHIGDQAGGIDLVLGYPRRQGNVLFNAAGVLREGRIVAEYRKQLLPNYSVFDEKRYFEPGHDPCVVEIGVVAVGLTICEDIWQPGAAAQAAGAGAQLILNLNASPFHSGKALEREAVLRRRVSETGLPVVYVNLVGAQDELVFDGGSFVMGAQGEVTQRCPFFAPAESLVEFKPGKRPHPRPAPVVPAPAADAGVYQALVLGVRDYVRKNGFQGAVLGLSGGIDSALTLAVAVDALGAERVEAVMMPSEYTASMSMEDAEAEARALGVAYRIIPIGSVFHAFLDLLKDEFRGKPRDTTEENVQARCRGIILMAISNKEGKIVLSTGNKSEMSVGYATLYGDMAGGFAVLKDVNKALVYRLARYRNRLSPVIPERVITRPPSAELAPDQKDQDSLPPYEVLDPILERYVELDQGVDEIVAAGFDEATVRRVTRMVDRNEYKRRQAAPGVRITRKAFGRDRRYPITSGF